jgi:hypothetical protein
MAALPKDGLFVGFRVARCIPCMTSYWKTSKDWVQIGPDCEQEEMDFTRLAALLISLGKGFGATHVRRNERQRRYKFSSTVYCRFCAAEHPALRPDTFRSFTVYCRVDNQLADGHGFFKVMLAGSCPHSDWLWCCSAPQQRKRSYFIKCQVAIRKITHGPVAGYPALQKFGAWMRRHGLGEPTIQCWIAQSCYSKTWLRVLDRVYDGTEDLESFLGVLLENGCVKLRLSLDEPMRPLRFQGRDVLQLSWIPWWSFPIHEESNYLQLDASFRVTRPFAYSVPQALIWNEAVPLGFSFAPTESFFLFECFFADLFLFNKNRSAGPTGKPVLCDGGLALAEFCRKFLRDRFSCHRHLIEAWCASAFTGRFAARVLRAEDEAAFLLLRKQILADARILCKSGIISEKLFKRFSDFLNGVENSGRWCHGIWDRIDQAIARCTQHAERFHGIVNSMLRPKMSFIDRLHVLHKEITTRFETYNKPEGPPRRQLSEMIAAMRKEASETQKEECTLPKCVQHSRIMNARFNITNFPCRHTVSKWEPGTTPPLPTVQRDADCRSGEFIIEHVSPKACGYKKHWLSSSTKRPAPAKVYDHETSPKEAKYGMEFLSTREYQVVIDMVDNISAIWKLNSENRKLDKQVWALAIRDFLNTEFAKWQLGELADWLERHYADDSTINWLARYSAGFMAWAADEGPLPVGFPQPT